MKWSGRKDFNLRPPGPEPRSRKAYVVLVVSHRDQDHFSSDLLIEPNLNLSARCNDRDELI